MARSSKCCVRRRSCSKRRKKRLRGAKGPFLYFLSQYRKCKPGCSMKEIAKSAAEQWNSLSIEDKCKYKRLTERCGKRAPISPFILFFMRFRQCPSNRGKPITQVAKEAGRRWKSLTVKEKCRYMRSSMRHFYGGRSRRCRNRRKSSCRRSSRRKSSCRRSSRRKSSCRHRRRSRCKGRRSRSSCPKRKRRRTPKICRRASRKRRSSCRRRRRSTCKRKRSVCRSRRKSRRKKCSSSSLKNICRSRTPKRSSDKSIENMETFSTPDSTQQTPSSEVV